MTTVLDRPGLLILPFRPVERFHMAGKHNQKSHGHGGSGIADVGDTVSSKDGKVSGAVVSEYMAYKNKTTGAQEDWLKVETTGKKKWYQDSELTVDVKGPHGMARTEWVQTKTGGMLEPGQVLKTPNGVGEFVKTMHDKDGYWVYANVPGSKKKCFKTEEVQAGVAGGKGVTYKAPGGGGAASVVPKASSTSAPAAISKTPAPSISHGGKTYTVGGSVSTANGSGKISEVQGKWVKVEGIGKKKWYKVDELPTSSTSSASSSSSTSTTTLKKVVGTHPSNGIYHESSESDPGFRSHVKTWNQSVSAEESKALQYYSTSTGAHVLNSTLRQQGEDGFIFPTDKKKLQHIDNALAKSQSPYPMKVYRGVDGHVVNHLKVGDVFEDKGYVSTSISENSAFVGHQLTIKIPKGSSGAYIKDHSAHPYENEWLLPRGSRFRVVARQGSKLQMELIP